MRDLTKQEQILLQCLKKEFPVPVSDTWETCYEKLANVCRHRFGYPEKSYFTFPVLPDTLENLDSWQYKRITFSCDNIWNSGMDREIPHIKEWYVIMQVCMSAGMDLSEISHALFRETFLDSQDFYVPEEEDDTGLDTHVEYLYGELEALRDESRMPEIIREFHSFLGGDIPETMIRENFQVFMETLLYSSSEIWNSIYILCSREVAGYLKIRHLIPDKDPRKELMELCVSFFGDPGFDMYHGEGPEEGYPMEPYSSDFSIAGDTAISLVIPEIEEIYGMEDRYAVHPFFQDAMETVSLLYPELEQEYGTPSMEQTA